jgi:hypothetical protein
MYPNSNIMTNRIRLALDAIERQRQEESRRVAAVSAKLPAYARQAAIAYRDTTMRKRGGKWQRKRGGEEEQ